jgi:hypothetical protein
MPKITRTTADSDGARALDSLKSCRANLRFALIDAMAAETGLAGARAERASELADKIVAAVAHCDRLTRQVGGPGDKG